MATGWGRERENVGEKRKKVMEFKFLFIKTHQAVNSKERWTRA